MSSRSYVIIYLATYMALCVCSPAKASGSYTHSLKHSETEGKFVDFLSMKTETFIPAKQKEMFTDGFSIYSTLIAKHPDISSKGEIKVSCVFTFDSWNERFKIVKENEQSIFTPQSIEILFDKCFKVDISKSFLMNNYGSLNISIKIDPVSRETAEDMKEWLKHSQPGPIKPIIQLLFDDSSLVYTINKSIPLLNLRRELKELKEKAEESLKKEEISGSQHLGDFEETSL